MIYIEIPIKPKGQERVRVGKYGAYKTKKQNSAEQELIYHLNKHRQDPLLSGAIRITISCYFPRPKAHYRKTKGLRITKEDAPLFHTNTPDWDNIGKHVCDCANGIIWKDDRQIVEGTVRKYYTVIDEPKIILNIVDLG